MLPSSEIRWFFPGIVPPAVTAWFDNETLTPPESRTDRYLQLPECTTVGVKLRQGRFEVKAQRGADRPLTIGRTVAGYANDWLKWSVDDFPGAVGPADWLAVDKNRRQRRYAYMGGGMRPLPPAAALPSHACTVEIATVHRDDAAGWTLGIEATGDAEATGGDLLRAVSWLFTVDPPPVPLPLAASRAYPAWLLGAEPASVGATAPRTVVGRWRDRPIILLDSISYISADERGAVVVSGSHGGSAAGRYALDHPPFLTVFNDAGGGKDSAGIVALHDLDAAGIAAVAVSHTSARIGDAADTWAHGVISHVNGPAARLDLTIGASLQAALHRHLSLDPS